MRYIGLIILALSFGLLAHGSDTQTFFIYTDNELHPLPADKASIPLTTLEDTLTIVAYAGAIWGEYDLSGREYCLAWSAQSSVNFDEWLENQGYRRKTEDD
ncbi:MAG: hypothetical protein HQ568_07330 [Calditrichaeota bacterium]|nr:hypothetical protein [Calditrichota bacterium]